MVLKHLPEQAEMIVQSDTVSWKPQCSDRIQETGCQASQTPVSKGRLQFQFFNLAQLLAVFFQDFLHFLIQSQIDQIVGQQFSDQELCGNIVKLLISLVFRKFLGLFFCKNHQNLEKFCLAAGIQIFPKFLV